jgi:CheY-like chemotaxis protein
MKLSGRNVLLVGRNFNSARALKNKLQQWKFQCHFARDMRAASDLLRSQPVDLVLSDTYLPDGTGFDLLVALADLPVTAFLCVPVENSCLWVPAIDGGKKCLGLASFRPSEFGRTLKEMALRLSA